MNGRYSMKITSKSSFPASPDKEFRPEEPTSLEENSMESIGIPLFIESFSQNPVSEKNESTMKTLKTSSIPKLKLRPRPVRKKNDFLACSFNTTPPKILIPFLPSDSIQNPSESHKNGQTKPEQKPLPPPPFIPQMQLKIMSAPATPEGPKTRRTMTDPLSRRRQKKAKLNRFGPAPLSSPPQLVPSFDFAISSNNSVRACKTPLTVERPTAPFATPPSSTITRVLPPSMNSEERLLKKNSGGGFVVPPSVAKPIAKRPFITPSNNGSASKSRTRSASFSAEYYCTPRRIFSSAYNNKGAPLSSSGRYSAFSMSSILSSSSSTIRRTLSTDNAD